MTRRAEPAKRADDAEIASHAEWLSRYQMFVPGKCVGWIKKKQGRHRRLVRALMKNLPILLEYAKSSCAIR